MHARPTFAAERGAKRQAGRKEHPSRARGYVDSPPIRIAFVSHVFWPERRRGGERLIRDLSDELIARGHSVRLVTSHRGRPSRADEQGLDVRRQWRPPERPLNRFGFPAGSSAAPAAWWSLKRGSDDVVHAWTIPAALAGARSGKPTVFTFQGLLTEADLEGRPRIRAMLMKAARECEAVTTYSEVAAREFTRITGAEAIAVEPGIRLDAFTPAADAAGRADAGVPAGQGLADLGSGVRLVILCAADPTEPRKRVDLLLAAFVQVRERLPDAELWLMPGAPEAPGVRIVDPGADQDQLVALYRSASLTVMPAANEAFGLVVVESLACGTPVVGLRDGGAVPSILGSDPHIGAVADPTADSLADAILNLRGDADACRLRAEDFSIARCVDRHLALYERLAN